LGGGKHGEAKGTLQNWGKEAKPALTSTQPQNEKKKVRSLQMNNKIVQFRVKGWKKLLIWDLNYVKVGNQLFCQHQVFHNLRRTLFFILES
jgi:hypothetical protein